MFYVYVLYSRKFNKIYVGFTSNLEQRFISHNEKAKSGWTIKFRPWKILFYEKFSTKPEAMKREKALKGHKGRDYIREMINKHK